MTPFFRLAFAGALLALATAAAEAQPAAEEDLALYGEHCERCHGARGRGDGSLAVKLGIRPRDFTLGSFKCRSTPSGSLPTDADLYRTIAVGLRGSPMTGFAKKLEPPEIERLVAITKELSGRFEGVDPGPVIEIPAPPEPSPDTVAEGRQVYRALQCWKCHGVAGAGDGPQAAALVDAWGEPIPPHDFTAYGGRFKCGGRPEDLYRTHHTGLSGTPMASYAEAFAFAGDAVGDLAPLADLAGAGARDELERYLAGEPDREAIAALSEAERQALVDRRSWALVHYLVSLAER